MNTMPTATHHLTDPVLFEQLVAQLIAEGGTGSFGKLHLVTILPQTPDTDWGRMMPKVTSITEQILRTRLGPSDACMRLGQGQYMLLFPHLSEMEGMVRATSLSQEIRRHLVGSAHASMNIVTQVLPLSKLHAVHDQDLDVLEQMDAAIRMTAQPHGISMSVEFQPVWDAHGEKILGNRARARRVFGDQVMYEAAVMFGGEKDPLGIDVNLSLAKAASACPPESGFLFLPLAVNEHTLATPGGLEGFAATAVSHYGGKRLIFEMAGDVANIGRSVLRDTVRMFHSLGSRVAARVLPERETAKFLRDCGVDFLCLNEAQAVRAGFTHSAVYALFTLVAHDVADLGFHLCLWNASTPEDVKRAVNLGFQLVSGLPLGRNSQSPITPRPLAARDVYNQ